MKRNRKLRRAGFTLVELLLVITILGILGTVVVMNFGDVGGDARKEATRQSIAAIDSAVTVYNVKVGKMPKDLKDLTVGINEDDQGLLKSADLNPATASAKSCAAIFSISSRENVLPRPVPKDFRGFTFFVIITCSSPVTEVFPFKSGATSA